MKVNMKSVGYILLGMLMLLIGALSFQTCAHAQERTMLCGQDSRQFVERRVAGKTLLACTDGTMSELLTIGGQTVFAEVRVTSPDEAAQLREDEIYRQRSSSYSGGYRSFPVGQRCEGNVSVIADYYTAYCREQRDRYNTLRANQHSPCMGDNAWRYADVCARQANGTYGRRH